jgi:two-component system, LuxR family, response regulator FixJ
MYSTELFPLPQAAMSEAIIYVVDDSPDEPGGLRSLLTATAWQVEFYATGRDFLDNFDPARCGCLLLDLRMRDMRGSEVQIALKERGIDLPTIIVTRHADVATAVDAMQRGAMDLLEKPVDRQSLLDRISEALSRDRQRREFMALRAQLAGRWARLTLGERAVVRMLMQGKSSREIGAELCLGRRTIENRRANIMLKMGATSLAHLVRMICGAGEGFPPAEPRE